MFLAIDCVSKFTYAEFLDKAGKMVGAEFLSNVVAAFPYKIHTVLTDNGVAFADLPKNRNGPTRTLLGPQLRSRLHRELHRAQGDQALSSLDERSGRAHEPPSRTRRSRPFTTPIAGLKAHVLAFVAAYNFAKHLKALRWNPPSRQSAITGRKTVNLQDRSASPHPETKHLGGFHTSLAIMPVARLRCTDYSRSSEPVASAPDNDAFAAATADTNSTAMKNFALTAASVSSAPPRASAAASAR